MAASADKISFYEFSDSLIPSFTTQSSNLLAVLHPAKYPKSLQIIVEFLKHCVLSQALTISKDIPMRLLNLAYSTATVQRKHDLVSFEVEGGRKLSISKTNFGKLIGITPSAEYVVPTSDELISIFNEMGHEPLMTKISQFTKSKLPAHWSLFFGFVLRCLTSRTAGLDSANKEVLTILYGLFKGVSVDYTTILWNEFVESVVHSKRASEVSSHRFWTVIVANAYDFHNIAIDSAEVPKVLIHLSTIPSKVPAQGQFSFIGQLPEEMLCVIPGDSKVLAEYRKTLVLPYPIRSISSEVELTPVSKASSKKRKIVGSSSKSRKGGPSTRSRKAKSIKVDAILEEEEDENQAQLNGSMPDSKETIVESNLVLISETTMVETTTVGTPSSSIPLSEPFVEIPVTNPPIASEAQHSFCTQEISTVDVSSIHVHPAVSSIIFGKSDFMDIGLNLVRNATSIDVEDNDSELFVFSEGQGVALQYAGAQEQEYEFAGFNVGDFDLDELEGKDDDQLMTRRDFKKLNRKLNVLLCSLDQSDKIRKQDETIANLAKQQVEQNTKIDKLVSSFDLFRILNSIRIDEFQSCWMAELKNLIQKVSDDNASLNDTLSKLVSSLDQHKLYADKSINQALLESKQREQFLQVALSTALSHISYLQPYTNVVGPAELGKALETVWKHMTDNLSRKIEAQLAPFVPVIKAFGHCLPSAPSQQGGDRCSEETFQIKSPFTVLRPKQETHVPIIGDVCIPLSLPSSIPITTSVPLKTSFTKGIAIGVSKPTSSLSTVVTSSTSSGSNLNPCDKGKTILIELSKEEKKLKLTEQRNKEQTAQDEELAKNDYETQLEELRRVEVNKRTKMIRSIAFSENVVFNFVPKESCATINNLESQLDLPISPNAFCYPRILLNTYERISDRSYTEWLIRFHAEIGKPQQLVWSLKGIRRLNSVKKLEPFEKVCRNFEFEVVRNIAINDKFTLADFPCMNPNDIITLFKILQNNESSKNLHVTSSVKTFLIFYYQDLARRDLVLANAIKKPVLGPNKELAGIDNIADGQILAKPTLGVVFSVKVPTGGVKKLYFRMDEKEKFTNSTINGIIQRVRLNTNNHGIVRKQVVEMLTWLLKVREVMVELVPSLFPEIKR